MLVYKNDQLKSKAKIEVEKWWVFFAFELYLSLLF